MVFFCWGSNLLIDIENRWGPSSKHFLLLLNQFVSQKIASKTRGMQSDDHQSLSSDPRSSFFHYPVLMIDLKCNWFFLKGLAHRPANKTQLSTPVQNFPRTWKENQKAALKENSKQGYLSKTDSLAQLRICSLLSVCVTFFEKC